MGGIGEYRFAGVVGGGASGGGGGGSLTLSQGGEIGSKTGTL